MPIQTERRCGQCQDFTVNPGSQVKNSRYILWEGRPGQCYHIGKPTSEESRPFPDCPKLKNPSNQNSHQV